MLVLSFSGWASCRLATDPDPFDDPRGTMSSFQQFALAGEPDLDRVIRFQKPPFVRAHTFSVGVMVRSAMVDGTDNPTHPLAGAAVELLDNAVLEGRNGAIANDVAEPIWPFHVQLSTGGHAVSRAAVPSDPTFPYASTMPTNDPLPNGEPVQSTGITDLAVVWRERVLKLEADLMQGTELTRPGIEERLALLRANLARPDGGYAAFFADVSMQWRVALESPVIGGDAAVAALFGTRPPDGAPWRVSLWFCRYDTDGQMFFALGSIAIPLEDEKALQLTADAERRLRALAALRR